MLILSPDDVPVAISVPWLLNDWVVTAKFAPVTPIVGSILTKLDGAVPAKSETVPAAVLEPTMSMLFADCRIKEDDTAVMEPALSEFIVLIRTDVPLAVAVSPSELR